MTYKAITLVKRPETELTDDLLKVINFSKPTPTDVERSLKVN